MKGRRIHETAGQRQVRRRRYIVHSDHGPVNAVIHLAQKTMLLQTARKHLVITAAVLFDAGADIAVIINEDIITAAYSIDCEFRVSLHH